MKKEKVIIELSGGVDSSVAAYLLKKEGYDVIAVTFNIWRADATRVACMRPLQDNDKNCCNEESVIYAKRVADYLNIPHYTICLKDIFYEKVVKDFIKNYTAGRTPNPCVKCNEHIKFLAVKNKLTHLEPFKLATGHYARIIYDKNAGACHGMPLLYKGIDEKKDQSYFLYCLKQDELKNIIFPLGNLTKEKVRRIAKREALPTHSRKESQEICFVPNADYKKFFNIINVKSKSGNICDINGKKLGKHNGILNYTIGQRRGLGISSPKPLYVVSIDAKNNLVTVGEDKDLFTNKVYVENINWIVQNTPLSPNPSPLWGEGRVRGANVKIRYNMKEVPAQITPIGKNKAEVLFDEPVRAATPGQSAVFYDGDEVLGGGIIVGAGLAPAL